MMLRCSIFSLISTDVQKTQLQHTLSHLIFRRFCYIATARWHSHLQYRRADAATTGVTIMNHLHRNLVAFAVALGTSGLFFAVTLA